MEHQLYTQHQGTEVMQGDPVSASPVPRFCPLLVIHDLGTLLCLELTPPPLNSFLMYFHFFPFFQAGSHNTQPDL